MEGKKRRKSVRVKEASERLSVRGPSRWKKVGGKAINPFFDRVKTMVNYLEGQRPMLERWCSVVSRDYIFALLGKKGGSAPLSRRLKGETLSRGAGQPSSEFSLKGESREISF